MQKIKNIDVYRAMCYSNTADRSLQYFSFVYMDFAVVRFMVLFGSHYKKLCFVVLINGQTCEV